MARYDAKRADDQVLVGVVSDTHGFYDPRVAPLLDGAEHILHAGDVGDADVVRRLSEIAPVTAVRGNNDREGECSRYPEVERLALGGCRVHLTHIVKVPPDGSPKLAEFQGADVVVFGHSHVAYLARRGDTLFFNPGAAGKRRFKTVPSVGLLDIDPGGVKGRILTL